METRTIKHNRDRVGHDNGRVAFAEPAATPQPVVSAPTSFAATAKATPQSTRSAASRSRSRAGS